jgi:membrane-associated phospholipid phosphatase
MRDASPDSVTPGGAQAPLGVRGGEVAEPTTPASPATGRAAAAPPALPFAGAPRLLAAVLALALVAYAAIAADVVEGGRVSAHDEDLSEWVAGSMPTAAEWLARALSWVGGWVGVTVVVAVAVLWLSRRGRLATGVLLAAVALGGQLVNSITKEGYDRPRPTAGSPVELPSSTSFPSGHAMSGIAVFGLLGLLAAGELSSRPARITAIAVGFGLGALIGASRVVLNVHFLTDVLAGAALGLAWLSLCLLVASVVASRRRRYADAS